ncbi:MAG: hypothetical protein WBQ18_17020 [Solirubrobacteraceae bacterium]|jgi:hypothetical protein
MTHTEFSLCIGLLLAACGHLLMHELLGAAVVWRRLDDCLPAVMRTPESLAGAALLSAGAACVLTAVLL